MNNTKQFSSNININFNNNNNNNNNNTLYSLYSDVSGLYSNNNKGSK